MTELPHHLEDLSLDERVARLTAVAERAAAWVAAYEAQQEEEFEPGAAPTYLRDAVEQVRARLASPGLQADEGALQGLREDLLSHLGVVVPETEPGEPDRWATLHADRFRAAVGLGVLAWVLAALGGDFHDEEREWLEAQLADARCSER